jgi:hypothetical protein
MTLKNTVVQRAQGQIRLLRTYPSRFLRSPGLFYVEFSPVLANTILYCSSPLLPPFQNSCKSI